MRLTQEMALALTIALEWAAALTLYRLNRWHSPPLGRFILLVGCASLLSHPFAWHFNTAWMGVFGRWTRVGLIELLVVAFEMLLYRYLAPLGWRRALLLSFMANMASFGLGLLIIRALKSI